jgi:amino acid permease
LSQGNEHLLSSSRIYFTLNQELFLPSSFSVHPHQERPWANTVFAQTATVLKLRRRVSTLVESTRT